MKTTSFLRSALLLTAATAGAEATPGEASAAAGAPAETAAETASKKAKKQHTVTLFENDKDFLFDLMKEFHGPQASNPEEKRFLSTAEGFHVLMEVATDNRWGHRQKTETVEGVANPVPVFDTDGQPVMERFDRIAEAAQKVIDARGIARRETQVSSLQAKIAELQAQLEKQKAANAAPVETAQG